MNANRPALPSLLQSRSVKNNKSIAIESLLVMLLCLCLFSLFVPLKFQHRYPDPVTQSHRRP